MTATLPGAAQVIDTVTDAVRIACCAPSLHNSQPWRWLAADGGRTVELRLDSARVLASDRAGRQAVLSCGAALDHLQVALDGLGWSHEVTRLPEAGEPDLLARVRLLAHRPVHGEHRTLMAVTARRSDRLPFGLPANFDEVEFRLRDIADAHDVHLDVLADAARPRLAQAARILEDLRRYDNVYHAELNWWTGPFKASQGIPYTALVSSVEESRVGVGRSFPHTRNAPRRAGITDDHARIVVLSTDADHRAAWLRTGEALSRMLLEATMAGLATCPLTHLTEVSSVRDLIATLAGRDAAPQVLVRIGHSPMLEGAPPPTPRRSIGDVLTVRG